MSRPPRIDISNRVVLGGPEPVFILGPCVIESEEFVWHMAHELTSMAARLGASIVFKASYDKANRTSHASFRGTDCRAGCQILGELGQQLGVPVLTDVHNPEEAQIAAEFVDVLQVPAFLCRQTDLIEAVAKTGRVVNVKKGQFLAPWDVVPIAEKLVHYGNDRFFFTERGVTHGYNNLVADMRSLYWIREAGYRVVFDGTHSVQRPGGHGDRSDGDAVLAPVLARAAVAAGCDGVFLETHTNPREALSDGPNQLPLERVEPLLRVLVQLHHFVQEQPAPVIA